MTDKRRPPLKAWGVFATWLKRDNSWRSYGNRIGGDAEGNAQSDFRSTFGLSQLAKTATRVTEKSKSLIDVALTTNENTIDACDVIQSAISDHSLVSLTLKLKTPRPRISFVTTGSYKNYDHDSFIEDLANVPFHIVNLFDDPDDQVHAFNCLFQYVLNNHAPIKQIKIHSRPNPFVSTEIKGLMNTRDMWHKRAMKTNDKLHLKCVSPFSSGSQTWNQACRKRACSLWNSKIEW